MLYFCNVLRQYDTFAKHRGGVEKKLADSKLEKTDDGDKIGNY